MSTLFAWVDGRLLPASEACVPVTDEGLLRGDGCFEVVRVYAGRPFALEEHLERMARSAAALRLPLDGVREAFAALCRGFDGLVRVLVTRGPPPRVYGLQEELRHFPPVLRLKSLAAPWLVPLGSTVLAGAKTLSYAHNAAARRLAEEQGFDDALLVRADGTVLEGPTWTVMWAEADRLYTPPLRLGILDSITRRVVMRLTEVEEAEAPLRRVLEAEEVFALSTLRETIGVGCIDDREWPDAPGPVTSRVGDLFRAHLRSE